jgi:hypothetical protein
MKTNKAQHNSTKLIAFLLVAVAFCAPAQAIPVDVELQLLVDISGSVNATEYNLQSQGYTDAFKSSAVQSAITGGTYGRIAVQFVYWSSKSKKKGEKSAQKVMADWTLIDSAVSANAFGDALALLPRPFSGMTPVGDALRFGAKEFSKDNGFEGDRLIIDISGDGSNNFGRDAATERDKALAVVDTINGLPILNDDPNLDDWYAANVTGGIDSFVLPATSFADFQAAIEDKLIQEINPIEPPATLVPEPITLASLGICIFGAGTYLRRRTKE